MHAVWERKNKQHQKNVGVHFLSMLHSLPQHTKIETILRKSKQQKSSRHQHTPLDDRRLDEIRDRARGFGSVCHNKVPAIKQERKKEREREWARARPATSVRARASVKGERERERESARKRERFPDTGGCFPPRTLNYDFVLFFSTQFSLPFVNSTNWPTVKIVPSSTWLHAAATLRNEWFRPNGSGFDSHRKPEKGNKQEQLSALSTNCSRVLLFFVYSLLRCCAPRESGWSSAMDRVF